MAVGLEKRGVGREIVDSGWINLSEENVGDVVVDGGRREMPGDHGGVDARIVLAHERRLVLHRAENEERNSPLHAGGMKCGRNQAREVGTERIDDLRARPRVEEIPRRFTPFDGVAAQLESFTAQHFVDLLVARAEESGKRGNADALSSIHSEEFREGFAQRKARCVRFGRHGAYPRLL